MFIFQGTAGTFNVALVNAVTDSEPWSEAFNVIPNQGYQDGKFTISVADPSKLDYENETWRIIQLKVNFFTKHFQKNLRSGPVLSK